MSKNNRNEMEQLRLDEKKINNHNERKVINLDEILDLLVYDSYAYCFVCRKLKISNDLYVCLKKSMSIICSRCYSKNYF